MLNCLSLAGRDEDEKAGGLHASGIRSRAEMCRPLLGTERMGVRSVGIGSLWDAR
jgi:hypothetical protein